MYMNSSSFVSSFIKKLCWELLFQSRQSLNIKVPLIKLKCSNISRCDEISIYSILDNLYWIITAIGEKRTAHQRHARQYGLNVCARGFVSQQDNKPNMYLSSTGLFWSPRRSSRAVLTCVTCLLLFETQNLWNGREECWVNHFFL